MEAIAELERGYFRWKFGINADHKPCFAWADERLLLDHEALISISCSWLASTAARKRFG